MILYHGTNIDIQSIDLALCCPYKDFGIEYDQAMQLFYDSQTFDKLMDIETGLYLESSAYVYGIFQDEKNFGNLVQAEI